MESIQKLDQAVVVVTGGGSGIGRALGHLAAQRGARVVVADLLANRAHAVAAEIMAAGGTAIASTCDVSDLGAVQALADLTIRQFGTVNLVCNNAGVCKGGSIEATSPGDARWMFDVNVFGMVHGIHVFAPLLRQAAARGEMAWLLNTGSENSLGIPPVGAIGIYNATKHAVLALSDNARQELADSGVGVSVVCPALVRTDLLDSQMHRHARWGGPQAMDDAMRARVDAFMAARGHDADETAAIALDGVQAGDFLIVPHAEVRPFVEIRIRTVQAALDAADARGAGIVG
jgi:NAD(P)-dependent dehydrogenase (short-subunit alcohol dehydrogenase family)